MSSGIEAVQCWARFRLLSRVQGTGTVLGTHVCTHTHIFTCTHLHLRLPHAVGGRYGPDEPTAESMGVAPRANKQACIPARLHASARLHACTLLAAVRLALVFRPFRTVEPVGLSSVPACLCVPVLVLTARLWPFTLVSRHACAPACLHTCL